MNQGMAVSWLVWGGSLDTPELGPRSQNNHGEENRHLSCA